MKWRMTPLLWYSFTLHLLAAAILVQCGFLPLSPLRVGNTHLTFADAVMVELRTLEKKNPAVSEPACGEHCSYSRTAALRERLHPALPVEGATRAPLITPGRPGDRPTVPPVLKYSASTDRVTGTNSTVLHQILRQIARARRYPPAARREKLEGRSVVKFAIRPDGGIAHAIVVASSGHTLLDTAALDTIRRAAPLPYYAEVIQLPIRFKLR